jgi:hypothetical protein
LIEHGWQLKRLHKLIMTSSVYMQESRPSAAGEAADPHDVYLWRWEPRRLEAEPIRDSMLAVAGMLDGTMFGPGTMDLNMRRRSIYFTVKRGQLLPMMMVLDWPEGLNSIGARPVTTVAPQALLFMNSPQARQYSVALSGEAASGGDFIAQAYVRALSRPPTAAETTLAGTFIDSQARRYAEEHNADPRGAAMTDFCQVLLSANEFVYVE